MKTVKLNLAKMWNPKPSLKNLFWGMPYIYRYFNFIPSKNPDFVFYSNYKNGPPFPVGTYKKIFYSPEKDFPSMDKCDFAFTHWYDEDVNSSRHLRLPVYTFFGAGANLLHRKLDKEKIRKQKTKFCAFVYHNPNSSMRNEFFDALSRYKRVDAPGRVKNNSPPIGGHRNFSSSRMSYSWSSDKLEYLKKYKFVIAFENAKQLGYTTEKIYHPMLANAIPIYWGNPQVARDFNHRSFIQVKSKNHFDKVIEFIVHLDKNFDKYFEMLSRPWYPNNTMTRFVDPRVFIERFTSIFT